MCLQPLETPDPRYPTMVDNGMDIVFNGGYAMFHDFFDEEITALICHDCVVKILELFSEEFRSKFQGGHPMTGGVRCCKYAWNFQDEDEDEGATNDCN